MKPDRIYNCKTPGCTATMTVPAGRGSYKAYCDPCLKVRNRLANKLYCAGVRKKKQLELLDAKELEIVPYKPKPRKILLTDAEQLRINAKAMASYDKIRHIPLEDIAGFLFRQSAWMFEKSS